jgi:hypothetical protein
MKYKHFSKIFSALLLMNINLIAVESVFACVCPLLPLCEAYSHSKAVFVGKVLKNQEEDPGFIRVSFAIEKAFKGKLEKVETARFRNVTCQTQFKTGEKYFVYELEPGYGCNPSEPLSQAVADLKYAESLSDSDPVFNIQGFFDTVTFLDGTSKYTKDMQVTIEKGETKYKPDVNEYGTFDFTTKEKGTYKIKILFNYSIHLSVNMGGELLPHKAKYLRTATQTSLEYDAEFEPNGCDSRYFYVFPNKANK